MKPRRVTLFGGPSDGLEVSVHDEIVNVYIPFIERAMHFASETDEVPSPAITKFTYIRSVSNPLEFIWHP